MPHDYPALARRWTEEVWNRRRYELIDSWMHPDCVVEVEGKDGILGREQFKAYLQSFVAAVPDLHVDPLTLTFEASTGFMEWRVTGTHTGNGLGILPSGKRVNFTGFSRFDFRDDLIIRGVDHWNRGELIASLMQVRMEEIQCHFGLTARESQVALMMAERMTHVEIAGELAISPNTARRHREHVLEKLGINRRQDVAKALGRIPGSALARQGSDLAG